MYTDQLTYSCDEGYEISDVNAKRTCLSSGQFDDSEVTCLPVPCPNPPVPQNGSYHIVVFRESILLISVPTRRALCVVNRV